MWTLVFAIGSKLMKGSVKAVADVIHEARKRGHPCTETGKHDAKVTFTFDNGIQKIQCKDCGREWLHAQEIWDWSQEAENEIVNMLEEGSDTSRRPFWLN